MNIKHIMPLVLHALSLLGLIGVLLFNGSKLSFAILTIVAVSSFSLILLRAPYKRHFASRQTDVTHNFYPLNCLHIEDYPDGIIQTDKTGSVAIFNISAQKIIGPALKKGISIKIIFDSFHQTCINAETANQVINALFESPTMRFMDTLYSHKGKCFERLTKPAVSEEGRIWIIRDVSHLTEAQDANNQHRSILEEDAIRMAEMAEQLYHAKAELEAKQQELTYLANIDSLSGLNRRRNFMLLAEKNILAFKGVSTVIMMDIDNFKQVNDRFGHALGDQAIREFSQVIIKCLGDKGDAGRMGGDEFAIYLPGLNPHAAVNLAETIRKRTSEIRINTKDEIINFTCSLGVAQIYSEERSLGPSLDRADKGLYLAKQNNRNSVVFFDPDSDNPNSGVDFKE